MVEAKPQRMMDEFRIGRTLGSGYSAKVKMAYQADGQ
jgi:hypothetical protein